MNKLMTYLFIVLVVGTLHVACDQVKSVNALSASPIVECTTDSDCEALNPIVKFSMEAR